MREKIITGTRDDGEKTGPMAKARRWAGGHKTMLVCIGVGALTAFAAIASCRTGHAGGVKTGYLAGFPDGRTEGYAKGHDAGYADGLADGMEIAADAMKPETIVKNTFPVASHVRRLHGDGQGQASQSTFGRRVPADEQPDWRHRHRLAGIERTRLVGDDVRVERFPQFQPVRDVPGMVFEPDAGHRAGRFGCFGFDGVQPVADGIKHYPHGSPGARFLFSWGPPRAVRVELGELPDRVARVVQRAVQQADPLLRILGFEREPQLVDGRVHLIAVRVIIIRG